MKCFVWVAAIHGTVFQERPLIIPGVHSRGVEDQDATFDPDGFELQRHGGIHRSAHSCGQCDDCLVHGV